MRIRKRKILFERLAVFLLSVVIAMTVLVGIGQKVWLWAKDRATVENPNGTLNTGAASDTVSGQESASDSDKETTAGQESASDSDKETTAGLSPADKNESITAFATEHNIDTSEWPKELVELLEKNQDAEEFVLNYPLKVNKTFDTDLSEYVNCDEVPLFFQWDERWGYTKYGENVMGLTGCGPTCLSMVCIYLLKDAIYTPRFVADFSEEYGYCVPGSGSAWTLISEGGELLGLDVTEIPLDENRIIKNLELGNPIICVMGPGDFTTTGHFIVMTGYEDGKIKVNDPNSKVNSEKLWEYKDIKGQIKNLWVCRI